MGPEDDWDPIIQGPGVGTPSYGKWKPQGPIKDISQLWFRQERQVLRRLPKSRAIVWCVHTYIEPMDTVAREPGVSGRLASLVRSWDPVMAKYFLTFCVCFLDKLADCESRHKGRHNYEHVLLPYLDSLHKEQVENGICEDGELPSKFPW